MVIFDTGMIRRSVHVEFLLPDESASWHRRFQLRNPAACRTARELGFVLGGGRIVGKKARGVTARKVGGSPHLPASAAGVRMRWVRFCGML